MSDSPSPDSPHIARPPNSFFLYRIDKNKEMKETKTSSGTQSQISKAIAQQWHREPLSVRIAYKKRADAAKERHAQLHPHYRYKAGKKKVKSDAHPAYRKIGPRSTRLGVPPPGDYPSVLFPQNGGEPPSLGSPFAGPSGYTSPGPSASSHNLRPRRGASYVQPNSEQPIPNDMSMEEYRNMLVTNQLHQQYMATRAYAEQAWHILHNHLLRTTTQFHSRPPNNPAQAVQHAMLAQMQNMPLHTAFPVDQNNYYDQHYVAPTTAPAYMPWQMGPPGPPHAGQPWQWNDQHAPLNAGFSDFDFANATAPADVAQRVPTPRIRRAPVQPQYPPEPLDVGSFDLTQNAEGPSQVHAQISLPTIPQALEMPRLNEAPRWDPYSQVVSAETGMLPPPTYIFPSPSATLDTGAPPQDSLLLGAASSGGHDPLIIPLHSSSGSSSSASGSQDPSGRDDSDSQDQMQSISAVDASLGLQDEGSSLWTPSDRAAGSADHFDPQEAQGWFNFSDE